MRLLSLFYLQFDVYAIEKGVIQERPITVKVTRNYLEFSDSYDKISPYTRAKYFDYTPSVDGKFLNRFNSKLTVTVEDYNDTLLKPNFKGYSDYQFYCNLNWKQIVIIKTIRRKYTVLNINIKTVFWEYVIVVIGSYYTVKGMDNLIANLKSFLRKLIE